MKPRNAYCSFCRKSYLEVGPLVEGPGNVYICGECIELSQSIIDQERRRRTPAAQPVGPEAVRAKLDQLVNGQVEAKQALMRGVVAQYEGRGKILLLGPSSSAKSFLARALAHSLEVPFAAGDSSGLVSTLYQSMEVLPLLYNLLNACDFNVEAARHGVVYLDGIDRPPAQETLSHLWQGQVVEPLAGIPLDIQGVLFVCGGTFAGLDEAISRSGRHPEQPIAGDALVTAGARPEWVRQLAAIARAAPLDEETLNRMAMCVDFDRVGLHSGFRASI
jgi:ATP-dependent Clp protease ATP-binding subunit ClpX